MASSYKKEKYYYFSKHLCIDHIFLIKVNFLTYLPIKILYKNNKTNL